MQPLPPQSQLPPDLAGQLSQLQMRQQLAQALLGESMKPIDPARTAGRYVVPISPLEGLSKLGSTYLNAHNMMDATSGMAGIYAQANQRRNAALQDALSPKEALSGALTSNDLPPGPWSPEMQAQAQQAKAQAQPQGQAPRGRESLQDIYAEAAKLAPAFGTDAMTILDNPLYKARIESALKDRQLTDAQKNFSDPKTFADWQMKETHIMPTVVRDNSVALDPHGNMILNNPTPSPGTFNIWAPGSPNPSGNVPIQGATQNVEAMNTASARGTAAGRAPYETVETKLASGAVVPKYKPSLPGFPNAPQAQPVPAPVQQQAPPSRPTMATPSEPVETRAAPSGDVQGTPLAPQSSSYMQKPPIRDPWQTMPKIQTPQGIGQSTLQEGTAKNQAHAALEMTTKYGEIAAQSNQRKAFNDQALSLVDSADTGFAAARQADVKNILVKIVPGLTEESFANTPSATIALQKDLVNAATQKAKQQFGARITQSEVMLMLQKAAPNADMPKAAIKYLLNSDNAQLDYQTQQANDLNRYLSQGGDPQKFEAWYAKAFPLTNHLSGVHLQPKGEAAKPGFSGVTTTPSGKQIRWDQLPQR